MTKLMITLVLMLCSFCAISSPVNINTADAKAISESLLGIGQKKAEAIVKYRTDKGPFKTIQDLVNVDGIGEKTLEKIKADILLGDAETTTVKVDKK